MTFQFSGPITMDNASSSLADCVVAIDAGEADIVLDSLAHSDSSAVAVLIAAHRHALVVGRRIRFRGMPDGVRTLVGLYGLGDLVAETLPG